MSDQQLLGIPLPDHLIPALNPPTRGRINQDARCDIKRLLEDQETAWNFAIAQGLAVLQIAADRNGAYLIIAPSSRIYSLFGDNCCQFREHTENGIKTEHWLGSIGHIRVFWREVKCVH